MSLQNLITGNNTLSARYIFGFYDFIIYFIISQYATGHSFADGVGALVNKTTKNRKYISRDKKKTTSISRKQTTQRLVASM